MILHFFANKSIVYKTSIIIGIILLRNVRALLIAFYATFASAFDPLSKASNIAKRDSQSYHLLFCFEPSQTFRRKYIQVR